MLERIKLLHIPVGGDISIVDYAAEPGFTSLRRLFRLADDRPEKITIGAPFTTPPTQFHLSVFTKTVVMLVGGHSAMTGQPPNGIATLLYRCGDKHQGVIYGDAYLAVYPDPPHDEHGYEGLPEQWCDMGFWTRVFLASPEAPAPVSPAVVSHG